MAAFRAALACFSEKKWGVRLGPLTKATEDAPGPTLWARCEANQIVGIYTGGAGASQEFAAGRRS